MDGSKRAKTNLHKMTRFIQKDLRRKIIEDLHDFRISSEQDLRFSITFHLRKELKLNPANSKYRLATGLRVRRQSRGKPSKKEVDVVIQYLPTKTFGTYLPQIMIEIKEKLRLSKSELMEDVTKLRKLRKVFKRGFVIYLCRIKDQGDGSHKDKYLKDKAESWMGSKHDRKIVPIIINAYDNMTKARGDLFDTRWKQSSDYQRSRETAAKAAKTRKRGKKKKGNSRKRKSH